jgi:periplasmic protein CpxP/Spy
MDMFSKKRIITWMFILLIVCNAGSLITMWFLHFQSPPRFKPPQRGRPEHVQSFLERELSLSSEQSRQFRAMRERYFKQSQTIMDEIQRLRFELFSNSIASQSDTVKALPLIDALGEKQKKYELLTYTHFKELYSICTPEQQKKMQKLLREILMISRVPDAPGGQQKPPDAPGGRGNPPPPDEMPPWRQ